MKELKDSEIKTSPPKKPLIFYYLAALVVLMLLNVFLFPSLLERQVVEVPYSQFLTMVDGGQVGAGGPGLDEPGDRIHCQGRRRPGGLLQDRRLAG